MYYQKPPLTTKEKIIVALAVVLSPLISIWLIIMIARFAGSLI
jgi:hypothetical protein